MLEVFKKNTRSGQKRLRFEQGAPTKRNWLTSFNKHRELGWGPNKEKLANQFPQAMQVGVGPQHGETGKSVSTSYASWGGAPTRRNW
ncbi:hypothetical protein [Staphylococcus marylandisciuri]|uniref:hypothetical protein n=1 Tax=Staphylococcus marylandisciuri TaxID=2981529 RepID=UPI0021CF75B6|nr:hypothetical protein [Staphylococcus marylandisciuri]